MSAHDIHAIINMVESAQASLLVIDKPTCLSMVKQLVLLQEIAHRWYNLIKMIESQAVSPWWKATAEMELSEALYLITSIQTPNIESLEMNVTMQMNEAIS